ncbi:CDKN2A-interacting protein isoform X2 [Carettochelys insculpta]|uniref:CDKN2A-interacting protein isoform X2 n=1 Tax=Carettochelys insculpta TaxID=44489 RepID=UPI003EBB4870
MAEASEPLGRSQQETAWVEKLRGDCEPEGHWRHRREFLLRNAGGPPAGDSGTLQRLVSLSMVWANHVFLGCRYPLSVMEKVLEMADGIKVTDAPAHTTRDELVAKVKKRGISSSNEGVEEPCKKRAVDKSSNSKNVGSDAKVTKTEISKATESMLLKKQEKDSRKDSECSLPCSSSNQEKSTVSGTGLETKVANYETTKKHNVTSASASSGTESKMDCHSNPSMETKSENMLLPEKKNALATAPPPAAKPAASQAGAPPPAAKPAASQAGAPPPAAKPAASQAGAPPPAAKPAASQAAGAGKPAASQAGAPPPAAKPAASQAGAPPPAAKPAASQASAPPPAAKPAASQAAGTGKPTTSQASASPLAGKPTAPPPAAKPAASQAAGAGKPAASQAGAPPPAAKPAASQAGAPPPAAKPGSAPPPAAKPAASQASAPPPAAKPAASQAAGTGKPTTSQASASPLAGKPTAPPPASKPATSQAGASQAGAPPLASKASASQTSTLLLTSKTSAPPPASKAGTSQTSTLLPASKTSAPPPASKASASQASTSPLASKSGTLLPATQASVSQAGTPLPASKASALPPASKAGSQASALQAFTPVASRGGVLASTPSAPSKVSSLASALLAASKSGTKTSTLPVASKSGSQASESPAKVSWKPLTNEDAKERQPFFNRLYKSVAWKLVAVGGFSPNVNHAELLNSSIQSVKATLDVIFVPLKELTDLPQNKSSLENIVCELRCKSVYLGTGCGKSKENAKAIASREALKLFLKKKVIVKICKRKYKGREIEDLVLLDEESKPSNLPPALRHPQEIL